MEIRTTLQCSFHRSQQMEFHGKSRPHYQVLTTTEFHGDSLPHPRLGENLRDRWAELGVVVQHVVLDVLQRGLWQQCCGRSGLWDR